MGFGHINFNGVIVYRSITAERNFWRRAGDFALKALGLTTLYFKSAVTTQLGSQRV
jgi:hypothetical protein